MRLIFLSFLLIVGVSAFAQNPYQLISVGPTLPNQPLIIVNGNVAHNKTLKLIDPEEIESLEVLKNAASAAIYGLRGANGVVLVKLKKNEKLFSYKKLLRKFKVSKQDKDDMPYLDHQPLESTADFYASVSRIQTIQLAYRNNGISNVPYLNIVTKK